MTPLNRGEESLTLLVIAELARAPPKIAGLITPIEDGDAGLIATLGTLAGVADLVVTLDGVRAGIARGTVPGVPIVGAGDVPGVAVGTAPGATLVGVGLVGVGIEGGDAAGAVGFTGTLIVRTFDGIGAAVLGVAGGTRPGVAAGIVTGDVLGGNVLVGIVGAGAGVGTGVAAGTVAGCVEGLVGNTLDGRVGTTDGTFVGSGVARGAGVAGGGGTEGAILVGCVGVAAGTFAGSGEDAGAAAGGSATGSWILTAAGVGAGDRGGAATGIGAECGVDGTTDGEGTEGRTGAERGALGAAVGPFFPSESSGPTATAIEAALRQMTAALNRPPCRWTSQWRTDNGRTRGHAEEFFICVMVRSLDQGDGPILLAHKHCMKIYAEVKWKCHFRNRYRFRITKYSKRIPNNNRVERISGHSVVTQ